MLIKGNVGLVRRKNRICVVERMLRTAECLHIMKR